MLNYGESLTYWYFRFNGFIPMCNFVLHGDTAKKRKASDCDLVALRPPHVWEVIGGQDNDWDRNLLGALGYDGKKTLAALIQVKTGEDEGNRPGEITEYFERHLEYLTCRLGFWPRDEARAVAERFKGEAVLPHGDYVLSKVVILRDQHARRSVPQWIEWRLEDMVRFIYERMLKYTPDKFRDRMFFPDHLIQFIAEQAAGPKYRFPPPPQ